ncbi:MAG: acyl-CoA ligase FadD12 [Mycobacterium sp.]|uniref:acyl-CoA ligase FadD12 n=1 Tax=Mycobacterium sp. TaxID=1785 RepID=UPI002C04E0DC|nr:acyl-CoA ligase FadD12 [Mycobacterium sp.]HME79533.1 acyl-CoA ligase FadD12 [Mycobacterium sp.]
MPQRVTELRESLRALRKARLLVGLRPDKYLRMAAARLREGATNTVGIAVSARRCPDRPALIDELGVLSYRELDTRANAFAAALQQLPAGTPQMVGIMCRNHRGFVDALAATERIGADALLLNTSFAGPALADVVLRERPDVIVYDQEFSASVDRTVSEKPDTERIIAWTDEPSDDVATVETLIARHAGQRPAQTGRKGKLILLTSGTTGTPKGARRSAGGGSTEGAALLLRLPWRAEETTVVVAPMFHAWGFGQLILGTMLSCTLVVRRTFDAAATMALVDRYRATGLSVAPVMLDRIMELPDEVRNRFSGRSLRFVSAAGSRMRPDVVVRFMDQFGDVIYNNYNATEVGVIALAGPEDLRTAPDTAGKLMPGTHIRILDENRREVPRGEIGQIFARTTTQFEAYTSGQTKDVHDGFMACGDLGYVDETGRLFVVGRDDEMIVSGGENVYPIEVEKVLAAHPAVAEASAIGVDDEQFGQRLAAFVVLQPGASATTDMLKEHVREHLANYKVPREILILDELPCSATGKILRKDLVARLVSTDQHT